MKKLILAVMLGAASLAAVAQTDTPAGSVQVPGQTLRIELPDMPLFMDRSQTSVFRGAYSLSNGQVLHMRSYGMGAALYGEIDEQGPRKMVAAGPNTFVALDRSLKVTIVEQPNGDAGGEVLMKVPAARLADGSWQQAQVVSASVR